MDAYGVFVVYYYVFLCLDRVLSNLVLRYIHSWLFFCTFFTLDFNKVPFLRSSLNHDDVFILDTASKVFLFAGCNSSTQEKAKALEVVEYIKDNKHDGRCEMATIG